MREKTPGQFVRTAVIALALCALMSFSAIAAEKPSYIGLEAAKQIALKHAGVSANDATFTKAKLDRDDGVAEYNIRFTSNKIRYRYEIDAKTGAVLSQQKRTKTAQERAPRPEGTQVGQKISLEQAKSIALKDAGVAAGSATFTKAKLDKDDGKLEYEIEFVANGKKYEYDILASNGRILKSEVESVDSDND